VIVVKHNNIGRELQRPGQDWSLTLKFRYGSYSRAFAYSIIHLTRFMQLKSFIVPRAIARIRSDRSMQEASYMLPMRRPTLLRYMRTSNLFRSDVVVELGDHHYRLAMQSLVETPV
jgi:hypothetical protein